MVDWNSSAEIAHDGDAFGKFMHCLLGLYIWEFCTSLDFDFMFITGKRKFRWPLIFYFAGRYFLLTALVGIAVALNITSPVNCQALYTVNQCFGNMAIGLASINLSLRTMAVWQQRWYIVAPLVLIIMGHWTLLMHGILLKAAWLDGQGCVITSTNSKLLEASFIYGMILDFIVMMLTAWKLAFPKGGKSKLVQMIFGDGLVYFFIAVLANMTAVIFMALDLNPVMSIIANVPAAVASTIVACRVVRRLTNFTSKGPELFSSSSVQASTLGFRSARSGPPNFSLAKQQKEGVHVQMDTFSVADNLDYDVAGHVVKDPGEAFDPEAQVISDEFKRPPY
ncbi:hypothetical protein EW146_g1859 [Bondarzewia mesenterica]|uniref:Transmembrane protein n=1 Tax=Bondarzewia mesenterica TaxID=1095465 RepID=A0A4S4M2L9_9AGAM|nr:hypothetical protein EW146_g1859 [Bondarzewia mesenterica]